MHNDLETLRICAESILGNLKNRACHTVLPIGSHWFGVYRFGFCRNSVFDFGGVDDCDFRFDINRVNLA